MDINGNILESKTATKDANPAGSGAAPNCSLPVIQRPSGVFPRQNSGINAILDTDMATSSNPESPSNCLPNSGTGQIRTSYERPNVPSPRRPPRSPRPQLRLGNIIQSRMKQGYQEGTGNSCTVLNRAFFDSVRDQVQILKNAEANESKSSYFSHGTGFGTASSEPSTIFSLGELQNHSKVAVAPCASSKFSIGELQKNSGVALAPCVSSKFSITGLQQSSAISLSPAEDAEKNATTPAPRTASKCDVDKISVNLPPRTSSKLFIEELPKTPSATGPSSAASKCSGEQMSNCSSVTVTSQINQESSRGSASNQVCLVGSKSREVKEIVINQDESGANLNINLTLKLGNFDGSSVTGFGLKKEGSQSHLARSETSRVGVGTSPRRSVPSSKVESAETKTKTTPKCYLPSVAEVQQTLLESIMEEKSGEWDPSCVTSVLSNELLAIENEEKTDSILQCSTTDVIYNALMSVTSSSTSLGEHQRIRLPAELQKLSSGQVFKNTSTRLSMDSVNPSLPSQALEPGTSSRCFGPKDENGNVIEKESATTPGEGQGSSLSNVSLSKKESRAYIVQGLLNALDLLEQTGDSIGSAASSTISILTNIVPVDALENDEETMNASESDLAIQIMKLLGVPKSTRHNIYSEACGEVGVLQDLGTGTYDAITTILKWTCGGKQGRKEFMDATRTLCSVLTEVDIDSEVWNGVNKDFRAIAEAVTDIADDIVEDGVDTTEALGNAIVKMVNDAATSALSPNGDEIEGKINETKINHNSNELEEDCKALEVFFDNLMEEFKFEELKIDENEIDTAAKPEQQPPLLDINNNQVLPESSSSQQFVPCLEELQQESCARDQLKIPNSPQEDALAFSVELADINNNHVTHRLNTEKLSEIAQSASLMYEPACASKHGHIEQASLSSVKFEVESALPTLENFFSNRTLNVKARIFKNPEDQQSSIINTVEDQMHLIPTVASSSAQILSQMPQAPRNSEALFDATAASRYEQKLVEDMTAVSKLVQDLYDSVNLRPPLESITKEPQLTATPVLAPFPTLVAVPQSKPHVSTSTSQTLPPTLTNEPTSAPSPGQTLETSPPIEPLPAMPVRNITTNQTKSTGRSRFELLPSRIPIPKQVSQIKRSSTWSISPNRTRNESRTSARPTAKNSAVSLYQSSHGTVTLEAEQSFAPRNSQRQSYNKGQDFEIESCSSATSMYSVSGDSVASRSYSRSFLKPTMSSVAKTRSKKSRACRKISATTTAISSAVSSSTRISSNTSVNVEGYLNQKTSASSMESNTKWMNDERESQPERPQGPQMSYQKIFQQKNKSIARQLSSKRFRF